MKSMVLPGLDQPLELLDQELYRAGDDEAIVELKAAALNKRDYWITKGKYPGITFPLILGSDGAGLYNDREVVINAGLAWGDDRDVFRPEFRILGMPDPGTLSTHVRVPQGNLFDKPPHLSWCEAAALPVCGVTAYRAMFTRGRASAGESMLVTGIGGGVATMALLFGVALGIEVWVTSSSDLKISQAVAYGAAGGANYTRTTWADELAERKGGRFDLVIDGAGGADFGRIIPLMQAGGRIVIYGGTRGLMDGISPQRIFWKQLNILGSTMGSPEDFRQMLDLVNRYRIRPVVSHTFRLEEANAALAVMARGEQFGKICIAIE